MTPDRICQFWNDAGPDRWFAKSDEFDARCRAFEAAHHAAARRELMDWLSTAEGALGLVLLLDQIPRNIFRGSAHAFATDGLAQEAAIKAVSAGHDGETPMPIRVFFYLPFEHAENLELQERGVSFTEAAGVEHYAKFARLHRDVVARFGRFPHRNAVLGRVSTPEEQAFLQAGGFSG